MLNELKKNCIDPSLAMNKTINFYPVTPKVTTASYQEEDCCVYKSIGQTLSNFFKTPYSPPAKAHSSSSSVKSASEADNGSDVPTEFDEEICASIKEEISVAESKEEPHLATAHNCVVKNECKQDSNQNAEETVKTEIGKRPAEESTFSSIPALSPVKKRSLFTQLDAEGASRSSGPSGSFQDFDNLHSGADASSAVNLTMSPDVPHAKTNSRTTSANTSASTDNKTHKVTSSTSKSTTTAAKPKPSAAAKKTVGSPGTKPITSFFARSPAKK